MVVKTNTRTKRICPLDHDKPEIDYSIYPEPPKPKKRKHPYRVQFEHPVRQNQSDDPEPARKA